MLIRTKIKILFSLSSIISIVGVSLLIANIVRQQKDLNNVVAMDEVARAIFGLNVLASEYAEHGLVRAEQQWPIAYEEAGTKLDAVKNVTPKQRQLHQQIRTQHDHVGHLFLTLVRTRHDKAVSDVSGDRNIQNQILAQITISQRSIMNSVEQWYGAYYRHILKKQRLMGILIVLAISLVVLSLGITLLLIHFVLAPIRKLRDHMSKVSQGNLQHPIEVSSDNEISRLGQTFNRMLDRIHRTTLSRDDLAEEIERRNVAEQGLLRFEFIINHMQMGLLVYHLEDVSDPFSLRIVSLNSAAERMLNLKQETVAGLSISHCFPSLSKTDIPKIYARLAIDEACEDLGEIQYEDENLSHAWYSVKAFGMPNHYVAIIFEDITVAKANEVHIRHTQKMEAVGQLSAGIAHEINTPIQFVGDNLKFLEESICDLASLITTYKKILSDQETAKEYISNPERLKDVDEKADYEYIRSEIPKAIGQSLDGIKRVADIVQAMKEFSHQGGAERSLNDLNKAIRNTVTISRNEWKYVANVNLELEPHLPMIQCEAGSINQVLLNLVVNAAHAIEEKNRGTAEVKGIITIRSTYDDECIRISISDTGMGIPVAVHDKVFNPFFTTKEVGRGTGQGLALAYKIINQKHNGSITFETHEGEGTTFRIELPV